MQFYIALVLAGLLLFGGWKLFQVQVDQRQSLEAMGTRLTATEVHLKKLIEHQQK